MPQNVLRIGFPDDITITFSDVVQDTGLAIFPAPARPAKFKVIAHSTTGDRQLDFRFRDADNDGTLSRTDEYIDVVTCRLNGDPEPIVTWRIQIAAPAPAPILPLTLGDVYQLRLARPFGADDLFLFTTRGERVDEQQAARNFSKQPYVVPNPYIASASFEPQRFGVSGRGLRRMEFRGPPQHCTIRIFTVGGDLVQTLTHDGSTDGMVPGPPDQGQPGCGPRALHLQRRWRAAR